MVKGKTTVKKAYIAMHDFLYDNYYKDYPKGEAKDTMIFMIGDMYFASDGISIVLCNVSIFILFYRAMA